VFYPVIISPNHADRTELRSLLEASGLFSRVQPVRTTAEAIALIEKDPLIDVVMLSYDVGEKLILRFLDKAKKLTTGKRCSYVVLFKANELKSAAIVNLMMAGIHSFLSEPYTIEALQETTFIASDVNNAHSRVRLRVAGGLLFSQMVAELGHNSSAEQRSVSERMRENATAFRIATGKSLLSYLDSLASSLLKLSPTKRVERTGGPLRTSIRRSIEDLFKQTPH